MDFDNAETWSCISECVGHSSWIYGVSITSDNLLLASVSLNKILVWNLETNSLMYDLEDHIEIIFSTGFHPNQDVLVTGSLDKTVKMWDIRNKKLIYTFAERKDPIHSVSFSPDGNIVAAGGSSKYSCDEGKKTCIYLWNVQTKELIHTLYGHNLRVNSISFSPDGKKIVSCSNDQTVKLWSIENSKVMYSLEVKASQVCFTRDGKRLLCSGVGGIKVYDVESGDLVSTFAEKNDYIRCFALNPSGTILASSAVKGGVEVWDLTNEKQVAFLEFNWTTSISFSPDGKLLAAGDASAFSYTKGVVKVWVVPDEYNSQVIPPPVEKQSSDNKQIELRKELQNSIKPSIDPDSEKLAQNYLNLERFPSPDIPSWITDKQIVKLADRSIEEDTGKKSNFQAGTDFENISKQALQYLGFTIAAEHKGGAGGLDLVCSAPYPMIVECKAGKSIPNGSVKEVIVLGKSNLNNDDIFNEAVKIVIGAGKATEFMINDAMIWKVSIINAATLQKIVELQAQYPGCIDLFELRQYFVPAQCDDKIAEYIQKVRESIQLRIYITQIVKKFLEATNFPDSSIDGLYGAYSGAHDRPKFLSLNDFRDILVELSSPIVGCLGRKSDRFYYLRSLSNLQE